MLVIARGFGGFNSALVLRRARADPLIRSRPLGVRIDRRLAAPGARAARARLALTGTRSATAELERGRGRPERPGSRPLRGRRGPRRGHRPELAGPRRRPLRHLAARAPSPSRSAPACASTSCTSSGRRRARRPRLGRRRISGFSFSRPGRAAPPGSPSRPRLPLRRSAGRVVEEVTRDEQPEVAEPLDARHRGDPLHLRHDGRPEGRARQPRCASSPALASSAASRSSIPRTPRSLVIPISHAFGLPCLLAAVASGGSRRARRLDASRSAPLLRGDQRARAPPCCTARRRSSPTCSGAAGRPARPAHRLRRRGRVARRACSRRLDAAGLRDPQLFGLTEIGRGPACRASDPPRYGPRPRDVRFRLRVPRRARRAPAWPSRASWKCAVRT